MPQSLPTVTCTAQFLLSSQMPLDKTSQVANLEALNALPPYVGKLVHVISEGKIYLCIAVDNQTLQGTWTPLVKDNGTVFYIRTSNEDGSDAGEVFEIRAKRDEHGKGRLDVVYPDEAN